MYLILHGFRDTAVGSPELTPLHFCLWGWMKSEAYKRKVDKPDELLSRILDAAARIKKCQEQLRLTTRLLRSLEEYTEVEVGFPNIYCEL
jgi:hypothetical protein